jgi:AAA+ ATPase superfamily predicted ATPase
LLFPDDFNNFGTPAAIRKALQRLREKGLIKQVAQGIYVRPKISELIGEASSLLNQALREIGKDNPTDFEIQKIVIFTKMHFVTIFFNIT